MLQHVLKKLITNKQSKSSVDIQQNAEASLKKWQSHEMINRSCVDSEILLRTSKSTNKYNFERTPRKRIVSCPDYTDLQLMYRSVDMALVDLRRICEEGQKDLFKNPLKHLLGEQFLQEDQDLGIRSDMEEFFEIDTDKEEDEKIEEDVYCSTDTLEDRR